MRWQPSLLGKRCQSHVEGNRSPEENVGATYHYKVMPFGLKNAGATYQMMMTRMLEPQLGKNIEVYIDNMVVKSKLESEHVNDLGSIFDILRRHKL